MTTKPVHQGDCSNNEVERVFVMYHGTKSQRIDSILQYGLMPSEDGMLGPGIYVSTDFNKAKKYGDVVLKILVYVGKVRNILSEKYFYEYIMCVRKLSVFIVMFSGKEDYKHARSFGQALARQI